MGLQPLVGRPSLADPGGLLRGLAVPAVLTAPVAPVVWHPAVGREHWMIQEVQAAPVQQMLPQAGRAALAVALLAALEVLAARVAPAILAHAYLQNQVGREAHSTPEGLVVLKASVALGCRTSLEDLEGLGDLGGQVGQASAPLVVRCSVPAADSPKLHLRLPVRVGLACFAGLAHPAAQNLWPRGIHATIERQATGSTPPIPRSAGPATAPRPWIFLCLL